MVETCVLPIKLLFISLVVAKPLYDLYSFCSEIEPTFLVWGAVEQATTRRPSLKKSSLKKSEQKTETRETSRRR